MKVVHCKRDKYDVLIDRTSIFGNPWSHKEGTLALFVVDTRWEAIDNYRKWLKGEAFHDVLPDQRQAILAHLPELKGKTLGCWCAPKRCHGEVLIELIEGEPDSVLTVIEEMFGIGR